LAYTNGNLAMQPKRKKQEEYVIRETRKKIVTKKSIPVQEKLLYLFTVIAAVVIAGVIIFRYAQIYDMNLHIKQLNNEMQAMTIEVEQLQRQVQTLNDPERIRRIASSQGMVTSSEQGIVIKKNNISSHTAKRE